MRISNFEETGLQQVAQWIERSHINELDEQTCKEALKTVNLFFVAEGINRIASTLLCEIKASYIQQSQRYVTMTDDGFTAPSLEAEDQAEANKLVKKAYQLYSEMSELKEGDFKGRPKLDHYRHGIPIEDARYILPLSTKTNICVSMSGDKLYDLYKLLNDEKYSAIFEEFKQALTEFIPEPVRALLPSEANSDKVEQLVWSLYQNQLDRISHDSNMILLESFRNLDLQVGLGALTSTQSRTSSEILAGWGDEATDKARSVTERVLGYGHDSIAEQARTTFGMMCSLVTYHQQVRHRLPESYREHLHAILLDTQRQVVVPDTIRQSSFYEEYLQMVQDFKQFRLKVLENYGQDKAYPYLLNADQIKMIISTNARMDVKMLSERTCMNAQWEIRELAIKKLTILRSLSPTLYDKALPSCVVSKCKEGKLSCGMQVQVREMFARTV